MPVAISFEKSLKIFDYYFRWSGMNYDSARKSPLVNKCCLFFFFFNLFCINSDVTGSICWFINAARRGDSLTSLTYMAPCVTICMISNTKSISFLFYKDHVNELVAIIRRLEIKANNREQCKEKDEVAKKETDFLHSVLKVSNVINWWLAIAFSSMPLILMLLNYYKTNRVKLVLPLLIEYPFDEFDIRYYPFVYVQQVYATIMVVLSYGGADCLYYTCCTYIRIQFRLLQYEIGRIISVQNGSQFSENSEFHSELMELIIWHQQLIRSVHLLEVVYSKSTLCNFVSSSALICLCGFNITTIDDPAFVVSFISFLLMSLVQIFFLCLFGDLLTTASMGVGDGIYNSEWHATNDRTAKQLHFIQIRAQNRCKLTAYGFAEVNIKSFTRILSTSWSYFALLRTMYRSND